MTLVITRCPACGSGAYVEGVCATCGYRRGEPFSVARMRHRRRDRRARERLAAKQRSCPHDGGWEFVADRWHGNERHVAERCRKCGIERQVASEEVSA